MSKNIGRSYLTKKTNRLIKALNTTRWKDISNWFNRYRWSVLDMQLVDEDNLPLEDKPLTLEQYLIETKEVRKAEERMVEIEDKVHRLSTEEKDKRDELLEKQKEGVGHLIW
jgi:hypothetical protein